MGKFVFPLWATILVCVFVTALFLLAIIGGLGRLGTWPTCPKPIVPLPINQLPLLLDFAKNNTISAGNTTVPRSYNVDVDYFGNLPGYEPESFKAYTNAQRYDKFTAIFNQENIINIYDSSVWAIALVCAESDNLTSYAQSYSWFKYLAYGTSPENNNFQLMGSKPNEKWNFYKNDLKWLDGSIGEIGFGSRGLPIRGYSSQVPPYPCTLLNQTIGGASYGNVVIDPFVYSGCEGVIGEGSNNNPVTIVPTLFYTWSDHRYVLGEAAWTLLAICHLINCSAYRTETVLPAFAARLVNTFIALECGNQGGAVYYSPQLYEEKEHVTLKNPGWDQLGFSTENQCSLVASLYAVTKTAILPQELKTAALGLATRVTNFVVNQCVKLTVYTYDDNNGSTIDVQPPSVVQGSALVPLGVAPLANGDLFAVDCFTWLISIFGNALEARQENLCIDLWRTLKTQCGVVIDNEFKGFGFSFTTAENVISGEWTLGAIFAARSMLLLYVTNQIIFNELQSDIKLMNKTIVSMYTTKGLSVPGTAVLYANQHYAIPFGWFAEKNASMASTTWQIFNLTNFNPFNLDGSLSFVV